MGKMVNFGSKKALEVALSRLKGFDKAKVRDEQYITPSSVAAEVIWKAYLNGDIDGKVIVDLGSGTGILGIGCLGMGAKRVIFIEKDNESIRIMKENLSSIESEDYKMGESHIICKDIRDISRSGDELGADMVITNPPFGTKQKHADKNFLDLALFLADVTYSFHKTSTKEFIKQFARDKGFKLIEEFGFKFMLKNTMKHHEKKSKYIDVVALNFQRYGNEVLSTRK